MQISTVLEPSLIKLDVQATKRMEAIREVTELLKDHAHVLKFDVFWQELVNREKVEPTCLGNEIAFPHARTDALSKMVLAVGRNPQGVLFENCNQIVKLIFVIGTPKRMVTDYLAVVGSLARLLKEPEVRQGLLFAETTDDFIAQIKQAESTF